MSFAVVYRFFDEAGRLLYVGTTSVGPLRWTSHAISQPWWSDVATAKIAHYPSVEDALEAERIAIETEDPLHNVIHRHRGGPKLPPRPRRSAGLGSVFFRKADSRWVAAIARGPRGNRKVNVRYCESRAAAERALIEMLTDERRAVDSPGVARRRGDADRAVRA